MYISEEQIKTVIETLKKNEYKLSDDVLREIAIEIISNLNKVIYNGT